MIMMSDRTGRAWRTSWGGALDLETEARREAVRVMAATERDMWAHNGPWHGLVFGAGGALVSRNEGRAALAEALSAAVADGGLLDRLAGGAR